MATKAQCIKKGLQSEYGICDKVRYSSSQELEALKLICYDISRIIVGHTEERGNNTIPLATRNQTFYSGRGRPYIIKPTYISNL